MYGYDDDDVMGMWGKGIKKFPSYEKDFDSAMSYSIEDGFPRQDNYEDDERFSEQFKRAESEQRERSTQGGQEYEEDELFSQRIKSRQKPYGNIFGNSMENGIFSSGGMRKGGLFGGGSGSRKKKGKGKALGLFRL